MGNFAGVDWASEKHDVLIANAAGRELFVGTFVHDEAGITGLCRALIKREVQVVAIERPDGLLVERLLEAGVRVLALHPNQVKAARDGSVPRVGSPTVSTALCCASWHGLTATASGCWNPTAIRPRRLGR